MTSPVGILLVDKPVGPTSHDIVGHVRKAAGIRRVGHAGTLDPFASGLLLLLLGTATRLSEYFIGMDKEYEAELRLGIETTTHDPEGEVVSQDSGWEELDLVRVQEALEALKGTISQRPPAYSAKKIQGEAAHRRVRRGEPVELDPVEVHVYSLSVLEMELPNLRLAVRCSSGTYIRALARDLGRSLGVGAHLSTLRRQGIGPFSVESACSAHALKEPGTIRTAIIPSAEGLAHFPSFEVGPEDATRIRQGQALPIPAGDLTEDMLVTILFEGSLLAVAAAEGDRLRPKKVLAHG